MTVWVAGSILGAGVLGAGASIYGASTQSQAEQNAQQQLAQQEGMTLSTIKGYLKPYAQAGKDVLPTLQSLITPGPNQTAALSQTPGFQFTEDWINKGAQAAQSTRGLGGNLLARSGYASGLAAEQTWSDVVNKLMGVYNTGAQAAGTAAGTSATAAESFAPAIAKTTVGQANALAGGATGAAGAVGGSVNQLTNLAILRNLIGGGMYGKTPDYPLQGPTGEIEIPGGGGL